MGESMEQNSGGFDFVAWSTLAHDDPAQFERRRRELIDTFIATRRFRARLRGLQCRIDMERRHARTPLKSLLRISAMMWDKFFDLKEFLHNPHPGERGSMNASGRIQPLPPAARVLQFRRPD